MMKRGNRFSRVMSLVMVIAMLLAMFPAVTAQAADHTGGRVYFETDWDVNCVQLMIGHSGWSQGYPMTKETGNLYYVDVPTWGGAWDFAVFGTDSVWGGEGNSIANRKNWAPQSTGVDNSGYQFEAGNKYLITSTGADNISVKVVYDVTVAATTNGTVTADKVLAGDQETVTLTVTPNEGYELDTLSVKQGTTDVTVTGNAFTMPAGDVTVTASFKASVPANTVYCINSSEWASVSAYAWNEGGAGTAWPGIAMTKTDKTVNGYDVYSVTFDQEYANIIFNNNNNGSQTSDLTFENGKYYDVASGKWYDSLTDVPENNGVPTGAYLAGSFNGWSTATNEFKKTKADAGIGYVSLELEADTTYQFKVVNGGTWLGNGGTITESITGWVFSSEGGDCTITTAAAGTYIFAFTLDGLKLDVTYPSSSGGEGGDSETPTATYIVAGTADLCGTEWDTTNTANQMTLNADGLYEKVYTNVAAGTYEFKVTDGTWDNSWGDGTENYRITVDEESNVTILFNEETKAITVNVEPVSQELSTDYYLVGYLNNADYSGTGYKFEKGKLTVTFTATSYVQVKNAAGTLYAAETYCQDTTVTLKTGVSEKMQVPGGVEVTFTLAENADGTLTLSYEVGTVEIPDDAEYYLIGYLNNADYSGENYKFEGGKLTVTFDAVSYVQVKNNNNTIYAPSAYCQDTTATLQVGATEKMQVPGGVELTFTLVENDDGTLTLSYESGTVETPEDAEYYLVGYINGADLGIADDAANLGSYKFVDGKLTATFTETSYVVVKNSAGTQYWAESFSTDTTVTLKVGAGEKMQVPGGTELEFTLVENADGTLTLSYANKVDVPEVPEGYNTVTIHFLKPSTWGSTVNAWVWDTNGTLPGYELYNTAWPGSPIPANAEKAGWYDLVIGTAEPQAFNFIFNDGSSQTADLTTGAITGPTELWVVDGTVYTSAPLEWTHYTATIHFQKPASWGDTVNVYAWNDGGNLMGEWPGTVTSASANSGWYNTTIRVKIGEALNFIFNDGNGNQTADLSAGNVNGNIELWIDGSGNSVSAPDGWIDENRTVHVPGTFPGPSWDAASNEMTYDPELGLYVITFKDVTAGTYYYKIAINGSWGENYGYGGAKDGSDISVVVPEKQDVTIWYSDVSHRSVCSVDYDINATVTLTGTGIPEGTKMTDPNLSGLFTAKVNLPAGTYSDVTITFGDYTATFNEFTLESGKEVTFYFDPSTYLAYHNGSDKKVETEHIYFDTKDLEYKDPFGAVAAGADVTFAIDTGTDATQVSLVVKGQKAIPMEPDGEAVDGVQRWTCTTTFANLGEYQYYFAITNGSDMVFYTDDIYNNYYKKGDYGTGTVRDIDNLFPYDLVVYESGYETPDWMKNAVIYQIFPDRFFDGDVTNNQAQTDARGSVDYEYVNDWYLWPENPEQSAESNYPIYAYKGDGEWSNEIYGGDLEGITQRIGYLKALGVNVIYLNPVFSSISNHRYDACDYTQIDPILGTLGDFEELVKVAEENGMHIILDGVFNHVSDDSVYFDRYYKFLGTSEKIGAYPYWAYVYDYMAEKGVEQAAAEEAAVSYFTENYGITDYSYTEWFQVNNELGTGVDSIGLRAGKNVYTYEGWWGYDSMPVIYSTNGSEYQTGNWAEEIITGDNSVNAYWISKGMDGWRLDVANEVSDETWINFRDSVKALNSEAVIIGEIWADSTHYLMGNMYDSVMNYVFRDAVAGFARGYLINRDDKTQQYDSDLTAAEALTILEILRERYPEEAFYAMMNLVGSHDTARILSYLDDVEDDRYQKDMDSAFPTYEKTSESAKQLQYVVSFIQFTYAGAPTIYYGDEIGMVGGDDPDDRRAMEWGKGQKELVEWYAELAAIRAQYPALRTGDVKAFAPHDDVMGYVRSDDADTLIVLANRASSNTTVTLDLEELGVTASALTDLVTGTAYTVADNKVTVTVDAYRGAILTENVKEYSVDYAGLTPAYDASYIVASRTETAPSGSYTTQDGQKVTIGETLSFTVDAVVNTFVELKINGETVDPNEYDVSIGTVVTLSAALIEKLGEGEHSISIVFEGGSADAKFTVEKKEEESKPTDPSKPDDGEEDNDPTTQPTTPGGSATTGDTSGIIVWVMVMVVALAAIIMLVLLGLKKKEKE